MCHSRTKDGFGRTGDLGYYRDDGVLCFSGRLKDLIKYQGNHLYPQVMNLLVTWVKLAHGRGLQSVFNT
jgi:acyl-CoA synthetase (AMP-forming)/AMP-acid ligase II